MVGDEVAKRVCGDHLNRQRIERHRGRQARLGVEGSQLSDHFAGPAYAEERFAPVFGDHQDLDPTFADHNHEVAVVALAEHVRVARISALTSAGRQIRAFRCRQRVHKPFDGRPRVARHLRHGVTATPIGNEPTVMSVGSLVLVFTSIVDTVPLPLLVTKAVLPLGVTATPKGNEPTVTSAGCLVLVFTSIVDTVPSREVTKAVLPSGVTAAPPRFVPTA